MREPIGVAVAGFGWMGRVHTQAYARVLHHFPQLTLAPRLAVVADEVPGRADEAAAQYGFAAATRDWRDIAADPSVRAVSIAAPNFLHQEIGVAMARAGKHIWIEKPVGLSTADATAVRNAAREAGVRSAVGFNYRNAPAVAAARELIASGELGSITHARFRLLSDYAAHPEGALSWRFERERGGSGVLGDLASHGVDLAWYLLGDIDSLVSDTATFLTRRAAPDRRHQWTRTGDGRRRWARWRTKTTSPACCASPPVPAARWRPAGSRSASRTTTASRSTAPRVPCSGTSAGWANSASVSGAAYQDQSVSTIYAGPSHGDYAAFQPGSANSMSYDDLKVIEAYNFLRSIAEGTPYGSTLDDAVRSAVALDAMAESAAVRCLGVAPAMIIGAQAGKLGIRNLVASSAPSWALRRGRPRS